MASLILILFVGSIIRQQAVESLTVGQLLTGWRGTGTGTTSPTTPTPKKAPIRESFSSSVISNSKYEFKGFQFDRTESTFYPTTPSGAKEFEEWEKEQEKKYTEEILKGLSTPNDTEIQHEAKKVIANFLLNTVKDNITATKNHGQIILGPSDEDDEALEFQPVLNPSSLNERQETNENEAIVAAFFGNKPRPPKVSQQQEEKFDGTGTIEILQKLVSNLPRLRDSLLGNRNGNNPRPIMNVAKPVQTFMDNLLGQSERATASPIIMDLFKNFRPRLPPGSSPMLGKQVQKLQESISQRNISAVLNDSLKIASPLSAVSFVNGIVGLVRCNTIGRLSGTC